MNVKDATKEVLTFLFEGYENDNSLYAISEIAIKHKIDQHELGRYLAEHGWIKNQQYRPKEFICQITLRGIEEIDSHYVRNKMDQVIQTLGESNTRMNIVEILGYEPKDYQKAFDLVKFLELKRLIKDTRYFGSGNQIWAELSLEGWQYYNLHKPAWT